MRSPREGAHKGTPPSGFASRRANPNRLLDVVLDTLDDAKAEDVVTIDITGDPSRSGSQPESDPNRDPVGLDWDVTWPIPIDVPDRVLHQLLVDHPDDVHVVIVRNGIVLHRRANGDRAHQAIFDRNAISEILRDTKPDMQPG